MPRMLVEPRRTRDGDLTGCTGATMEDGRVFRANRNGLMHVDDPKAAKQMVNNPLAPGMVVEAKMHGGGLPGATCAGCGFSGFRYQASRPCPKCGSERWEGATTEEETVG